MEYRQSGLPLTEAIRETAGTVGPGIITAAATTFSRSSAADFYRFSGRCGIGLNRRRRHHFMCPGRLYISTRDPGDRRPIF